MQIKSSSQDNLLDEVMKIFSENAELAAREKLRKQSSGSGIARSQSVKTTTGFSDGKLGKEEYFSRSNMHRMEDPNISNSSKTLTASTKGRAKPVKETVCRDLSQRQSKDNNPYATLPRASNVISTAEGTTRRTSIHDFLSKDTRQPVSVDPSPPTAGRSVPSASSEYSPHQQSSVFHCTSYSTVNLSENDLGNISTLGHSTLISGKPKNSRIGMTNFTSQTFSCSNLHSDKVGRSTRDMRKFSTVHFTSPFLSINTELVSNVSGLPQCPVLETAGKTFGSSVKSPQKDCRPLSENQKSDVRNIQVTQNSSDCTLPAHVSASESETSLPVCEDTKTLWYEYGCV